MNKEQRERLQNAIDIMTEVQEEEQEKYDNAPENLQDSERVEKFQENADELQEAIDAVTQLVEA